jgi:membrane protease YdiL (CAAX protease family)
VNPAAGATRTPRASAYGRARSPAATAYVLAVLTVVIVVSGLDVVGAHADSPWRVPLYSAILSWAASFARFVPGADGDAFANPVGYVVIPVLLIAPVGLKWRDLGLAAFRRAGLRTAAIWLAISAAMVVVVVAFGFDAPGHVAGRLISNLTTNGFSEEILFRGLLLGTLVPVLGALRANVVQAAAFGVWHFGLDMRLAHGNVLAALGLGLLLQGTVALLQGVITLRTGNVVVASLLHDALDTLPL